MEHKMDGMEDNDVLKEFQRAKVKLNSIAGNLFKQHH